MPGDPVVGVRLTKQETELLDQIAEHEERTRSDVVRRALRDYAVKLGLLAQKKPVTRKAK